MAASTPSRTALITGCSTGIGRATALRLAKAGWPVVATARRPATLEELADAGCRVRRLDVLDESSMAAVVDEIVVDDGAVGILVNNAGYGLLGPVEELPLDEVRRQFETNVFGALRLVQLCLPGMRAQAWGRIVNVGSVAGRMSLPGGAAYHGTKHAIEAITDALRFEVRGFGIDVILVEPGAIRTPWFDTAFESVADDDDSPYAPLRRAIVENMEGAFRGVEALAAGTPDDVAQAIEHAVTARRPPTRVVVPGMSRLAVVGRQILPDRLWDLTLRFRYPTPKGR